MSYTIRPATADDVDEVMALTLELAEYEEMAGEVVSTPEHLRRAMFGDDAVVKVSLVETDAGEVAGHALWYRTFSTFLGETGIWLEDLFVRPPYRRRGIGRALLEHLRSLTSGRIEWDVLDWNRRAIGFYERMGATPGTGWTRYRWSPDPAPVGRRQP
ncbi:MAG: GNAT family N-acetyltransferase [Acidimicrobiales bacterium]